MTYAMLRTEQNKDYDTQKQIYTTTQTHKNRHAGTGTGHTNLPLPLLPFFAEYSERSSFVNPLAIASDNDRFSSLTHTHTHTHTRKSILRTDSRVIEAIFTLTKHFMDM